MRERERGDESQGESSCHEFKTNSTELPAINSRELNVSKIKKNVHCLSKRIHYEIVWCLRLQSVVNT